VGAAVSAADVGDDVLGDPVGASVAAEPLVGEPLLGAAVVGEPLLGDPVGVPVVGKPVGASVVGDALVGDPLVGAYVLDAVSTNELSTLQTPLYVCIWPAGRSCGRATSCSHFANIVLLPSEVENTHALAVGCQYRYILEPIPQLTVRLEVP
jgi:hypothetical protein